MDKLQLIFLVISILTFVFIILKIRKTGLNIEDAIVWIIWAIFLLVLSLFPKLPVMVSHLLGFQAMSNFLFVVFIFFLYIMMFTQAIQISKLKDKNKELIQKISIQEYEKNKSK